jgi:hypothetical protein
MIWIFIFRLLKCHGLYGNRGILSVGNVGNGQMGNGHVGNGHVGNGHVDLHPQLDLDQYVYDNAVDLIAITETWGTNERDNCEIDIAGFKLYRKDRWEAAGEDKRGGGVALYQTGYFVLS